MQLPCPGDPAHVAPISVKLLAEGSFGNEPAVRRSFCTAAMYSATIMSQTNGTTEHIRGYIVSGKPRNRLASNLSCKIWTSTSEFISRQGLGAESPTMPKRTVTRCIPSVSRIIGLEQCFSCPAGCSALFHPVRHTLRVFAGGRVFRVPSQSIRTPKWCAGKEGSCESISTGFAGRHLLAFLHSTSKLQRLPHNHKPIHQRHSLYSMSAASVVHTFVSTWDGNNVYANERPAKGRTPYTLPIKKVGEAAKRVNYPIDINFHWMTLSDGQRKCERMSYTVPA